MLRIPPGDCPVKAIRVRRDCAEVIDERCIGCGKCVQICSQQAKVMVGWRDLFRHFHTFAATILDRVYFLGGRFDGFDIRVHGLDVLDGELAKGRGCILLGSHLGSFEAVRAVGLSREQIGIRVLMDEQNSPSIRGYDSGTESCRGGYGHPGRRGGDDVAGERVP